MAHQSSAHAKTKSNVIFEMSDKNVSPQSDFTSTPPTNKKVRNPFDKALIDRLTLHQPICSPSMCKIYENKSKQSFRWEIEQECTIKPANIEACSSQYEPSPDPNLEKIAEEATDKFFSQEMVMPSPMESSKKVMPLIMSLTEGKLLESIKDKSIVLKEVSAQTVLSLPSELPPELEKMLKPYFTYYQESDMFGEFEFTANGSLRRKLYFEDHSDQEQQSECDSEQTDDEEARDSPPTNLKKHTHVIFSPDQDVIDPSMQRNFCTPLMKDEAGKAHNKILDVINFGDCLSPIHFRTPPKGLEQLTRTSSSLASRSITSSISPVAKISSDDEKANFTSPESDAMATCLDCIVTDPENGQKGNCFFKSSPNHCSLKRSASLKDSPPRSRKKSISFSGKRSLSLSSLHRSRSVQKLDFSMNMSVDGSMHNCSQADSVSSPSQARDCWDLVGETSTHDLVKAESQQEERFKMTATDCADAIDRTPVKGKTKAGGRHEISKIRSTSPIMSPMDMSPDNSLDHSDNPLNLEDKKIDFNNIDLKFLMDNVTKFDYTANVTKNGSDSSNFKKVDSGFNENTFYTNASSYYESAIKPSELTATNNPSALKEISNIHWAKMDSGFKDETSSDNTHFYASSEIAGKPKAFQFTENKLQDKENYISEGFSHFLEHSSSKNEVMSMSDVFPGDMTFPSKFSSTPSKSNPRTLNS